MTRMRGLSNKQVVLSVIKRLAFQRIHLGIADRIGLIVPATLFVCLLCGFGSRAFGQKLQNVSASAFKVSTSFAGSTPQARATAACSSLGSSAGTVIIPGDEVSGVISSPTSSMCLLIDQRSSSGNTVYSIFGNPHPATTTAGSSMFRDSG
jgi:hypothetical protein